MKDIYINKNSFVRKIFLILVVSISLAGCKTKKNIISPEGSVINKTQEQLVNDIIESQPNYESISAKVSLELLKAGSSSGMKVNSQLKMIKDKQIQLSIRAPFINSEVFRVTISPDEVCVIDRLSKVYAVEDIKSLEKQGNVIFNFNNLQSLFTDQLFIPGKSKVDKKDFNSFGVTMQDGLFYMLVKDNRNTHYYFTIDASDRVSTTNIESSDAKYSLLWDYTDFVKQGNYIFPSQMDADVRIKEKQVKVRMSFSNLDFDQNITIDTALPSKYNKVSVINILKNYIK